jgi:Tol biopolymer transport system component
MNRWVLVLVLVAALWGPAVHAGAATPEGPRLAISVSTDGPGAEDEGSEVITVGPAGEGPQRLVGGRGAFIGGSLSWSADGERLAFGVGGVESTASGPFGTGWPVVGVATVDGVQPTLFPRAFLNGGEPVMAPDGRSVAFQRLKLVKILPGGENLLFKSSLWLLDIEDGSVRRLTRWRLAAFLDPISYSPDGSSLVAVLDGRGSRIVAVDLRSHRSRPLALLGRDVREPTYSPDGTKLAFVRLKIQNNDLPERPVSELAVARADGTGAKRVLRRKGYISSPSWDPSGSRLAFTRNPPADGTGFLDSEPGNKVMAINADGTCLTRVFTDSELTLGSIAWQPGPGREAGPISC